MDLGAYELGNPTSRLSYAWAAQYGLPTDGSADSVDTDLDGMSNWQEWVAGTNPTNSSSLLQMLTLTNTGASCLISWQSVSGKNYFLQRSTSWGTAQGFVTIQSNVVGQDGITTTVDTIPAGPGTFLYRAGIAP